MSQWRLRSIADRSTVSPCAGESLRDMLRSGVLGALHEFSPPGEERWLDAQRALHLLVAAAAPRPKPEPIDVSESFEGFEEVTGFDDDEEEDVTEFSESDDEDVLDELEAESEDEPEEAARGVATAAVLPSGRVGRKQTLGMEEEEEELDMTPMIDMTFLLLIFFMVTSSVTPMANLQLPSSKTGRAEETAVRVVLIADYPEPLAREESEPLVGSKFITLADARLYFEDDAQRVFSADQIDAELQRAFAEKPDCRFILQAHRKMPVGVVRQLLKSAAQAGAKETLVGVTMPR